MIEKSEKLYNGITYIDDDLIEKGDEIIMMKDNKNKRHVWVRWAAIAACLSLVFVCVSTISHNSNKNESVQEQLLSSVKTNGDIEASSVVTLIPVENRIVVYEQLYVGSAEEVDSPESPESTEKLTPFVGEEYMQYEQQTWYRVKDMDEIKYLISEDEAGVRRLWEYRNFYVLDSELNTMREEGFTEEQINETKTNYRTKYPDAVLSPYTYGDVYRIIYNVERVDDIVSITASPSTSNNTELGKKIQEEVGTHTYTERDAITLFYSYTQSVVCYGEESWSGIYSERDKYTYSFSTDTEDKLASGEETWANRYLVITLQSGTTIDSWKYSALNGMFYEFGGIATEPLSEEATYTINGIFGIE